MKQIVAFLSFDGNCRRAFTFYSECLQAGLYLLPFSETPGDRIMHATLSKASSTLLMASDAIPGMPFPSANSAVMIHCESLQEIEQLFSALGQDGEVTMELQDTFWGARFGMLRDRFGINWMLNFSYAAHV